MTVPIPEPSPEPNDGYAGNPVIKIAVGALRQFGGALNRAQATALLRHWVHFHELSHRELAAVLRRFPDTAEDAITAATAAAVLRERWISPPDDPGPGVAQPGGGWISGPSSDAPGGAQ